MVRVQTLKFDCTFNLYSHASLSQGVKEGEVGIFKIFTWEAVDLGFSDLHMQDLLLVSFTWISFYLLIFILHQRNAYSSSYHVEQRVGEAANRYNTVTTIYYISHLEDTHAEVQCQVYTNTWRCNNNTVRVCSPEHGDSKQKQKQIDNLPLVAT